MNQDLHLFILLSLLLVTAVKSHTVYVSPSVPSSSSTLCDVSTKSCMSLSQLAKSHSIQNYLKLDVVFLPGNYSLNATVFSLNGTRYVTLKSSTGDSSGHVINCHTSAKFEFKFKTMVNISGLTLNGCLGNEVSGVESFVMEDCRVKGNTEKSGRALVIANSTVHIVRSHFTSFRGELCVPTCGKGGAIYCSLSTIEISECLFTYNSATSGAALYVERSSDVTLTNSVISNNNACLSSRNQGGAIFVNSSNVILSDSTLMLNGFCGTENMSTNGGAIAVYEGNVTILRCALNENTATNGGAVYCHKGIYVFISESTFNYNRVTENGGVIHQWNCHGLSISNSGFNNNNGTFGGVLYSSAETTSVLSDYLRLNGCSFNKNTAKRGGVAYITHGNLLFVGCQFSFNVAKFHGGAFFLYSNINATILQGNFTGNNAKVGGALRVKDNGTVLISENAVFQANKAKFGAALHFYRANRLVISGQVVLTDNNATFGVLSLIESETDLSGNILLMNNFGSLYAFGSDISILGSMTFTGHRSKTNIKPSRGGCVTLLISRLDVQGTVFMEKSTSENGGGILAISSNINILDGDLTIHGNTATDTGGGVYLYQSKLYISGMVNISNNTAGSYGGGIHAISSLIIVHSRASKRVRLHLRSNRAEKGGGACMEVNAKFFITQVIEVNGTDTTIKVVHLVNNAANYGGAIYVADDTNKGTCSSTGHSQPVTATSQSECFFQISSVINRRYKFSDVFSFSNNVANMSGPLLFGGLLDRCTISSFTKPHDRYSSVPGFADDIAEISSSHDVRVCLCSENESGILTSSCNQTESNLTATKGEKFSLHLAAVDQMNRTTNATIHGYLSNISGTLGEGQREQKIGPTCTELFYSVLSPKSTEELVLYSTGPCNSLGISSFRIRIDFLPCKCPTGFDVQKGMKKRCECVCNSNLLSLPFIDESDCNSSSLMITRRKNFWISIANRTIVAYEECLPNYCVLPNPPIHINLDAPNGADAQCNFNRTGKLCGKCQKGLALSLGSSRCLECPKHWPAIFTFVTLGFILMGLLIVAFLLITNLTVATGTLNGVIFYANIIGANQDLFMPFQHTEFPTVFVHWLNLNSGFDFCFLKNMDSYIESWLKFMLPIYLMLIVIAIMVAGKYSARFAKVIGKWNPVATLATLILLSYATLLNAAITALSFARIKYISEYNENRYIEVVWPYDASVLYLKGKHIPLFIVAVIVSIFCLIYTLLLFFWQLLIRLPNRAIFRWVRDTKLSSFIDAYHAPFTARNRYWTGLLLLARAILHLVAAVNVSGEPSINLLAVSLVMGGILLLQVYSGIRTYKKWTLNVFEFTSYFNILAFSVAKYHVLLTDGDHLVIAYISVSVEFVLFLFILTYHMTVEFNLTHRIKNCKCFKSQPISLDLNIPFLSNHHQYIAEDASSVSVTEVALEREHMNDTSYYQRSEREDTTFLFT